MLKERNSTTPLVVASRAVFGAGLVFLVVAPSILDANGVQILTQLLCLLTLAMMWNLLAGYADIVTLGQHMFVGIGAYAFYGFVVHSGVNTYVAIGLAGATALLVAVPAMAIVFRLRAAYLAVGTWVVAEVAMLVAGRLPGFGFGSGVSVPISVAQTLGSQPGSRIVAIYWLAFALAVCAFGSMWLLLRSRIGIGLTAMRDNEEAAGASGVNLLKARVLCFLWTAPFLGVAGAIITLQKLRISPPASFSFTDWTVFIIFIVVIGGIGSLEGPIIGTILFFILREYLADYGTWYLILLGLISIIVMLVEPRGIWGIVRRYLGADIISVSHKAKFEAHPSGDGRASDPHGALPQSTPSTREEEWKAVGQ